MSASQKQNLSSHLNLSGTSKLVKEMSKRKRQRRSLGKKRAVQALYHCVRARRPMYEDVAEIILDIIGDNLATQDRVLLARAAKKSVFKEAWAYKTMAPDYSRPHGSMKLVRKAEELFCVDKALTPLECEDVKKIRILLNTISNQVGYESSRCDFIKDRCNRPERKQLGIEHTKRQYNKRWRFLKRMERKISRMEEEDRKYKFLRLGSSALVHQMTEEEIQSDMPTACFIAYYHARLSGPGFLDTKAYDRVSEMLCRHAMSSETVNLSAIAYIYPGQVVLKKLSEFEKGKLLGVWYNKLSNLAGELKVIWKETGINLTTMNIEKGNDYYTWNLVANAWNRTREHWIEMLYSMRVHGLLHSLCPGRALNLFSSNPYSQGQFEKKVWHSIPKPWDVIEGKEQCTKEMIEKKCAENKVSLNKWISTKHHLQSYMGKFQAECIAGVAGENEALAEFLLMHNLSQQ